MYLESQGKTYPFYRGDFLTGPRVIEEDEDMSQFDKDRIVYPPIQTKFMAMNDSVRFLQDICGYPYSGSSTFFAGDISHVIKNATIRNQVPEVIDDIDFFNLDDTIYDRVEPMLRTIPRNTSIYVHCDIGLKKDLCGISICYFDGEVSQGDASYPTFRVPLCIGISRKKGQATSLDHIFQFLVRLNQEFVVNLSADSFASAGLFQSCERAGIPYKAISVDKTTEPYFFMKNAINSDRVTLPYVERLFRECSELVLIENGANGTHLKIDHPEISSCYEFDYKDIKTAMPGTKDLTDSCCGAIWSCNLAYSKFLEDGGNGANKQLSIVTGMTKDAKQEAYQQVQSMLESIF